MLQSELEGKQKAMAAELAQAHEGHALLQTLIDEQRAGYDDIIAQLQARLLAPPPPAPDQPAQRMQARVTELEALLR